MGNVNVAVVAGNVTRDPEVRRTQSSMAIMSFGLAVNENRKNSQTGEWEDYASFIDVSGFGERWEKVSEYIRKGSKVTVKGRLRQSRWERDGQARSKVEVIAEEIELPPKPKGAQGGRAPSQAASAYDEDIPF